MDASEMRRTLETERDRGVARVRGGRDARRARRGPGRGARPQGAVQRRSRRRSAGSPTRSAATSGSLANEVRAALTAALEARREVLQLQAEDALLEADRVDLIAAGPPPAGRARCTRSRSSSARSSSVFTRLGFRVAEGPEIEDDWHNFQALNIPPDHPARTMKDSLYVVGARASRAAAAHRDERRPDPHDAVAAAARLRGGARAASSGARPPTRRTRRCSTRWRAWPSTRGSPSPT